MKIGMKVLTTRDKPTIGWHEEAYRSRKWGVIGAIKVVHFDHFEVEHDDGTKGFYEPHELLQLTHGFGRGTPEAIQDYYSKRYKFLHSLAVKWSREERTAFLMLMGTSPDQCGLNQVEQVVDLLVRE